MGRLLRVGCVGLGCLVRIADVTPPMISRDGQAALMIAYPATGEQDAATNALVNRLQDTVLPRFEPAGPGLTAYLTGPNAGNVSFTNLIGERLPWCWSTRPWSGWSWSRR